jgi:tRNA(Ile)-lysidine synthase
VDKKDLIIRENSETGNTVTESEFLVTVTPENKILIPNIVISTDGNGKALLWNLDGEKIKLPLKIRKKKDDDLFFPIGMLGKKKIAKFLKDEKLPILARQEIWLLCDGNDDILGVIPLRQDRRFAANKKTRQVLTLEFC